jgi:radical SAM protein (TIGR01212 family)
MVLPEKKRGRKIVVYFQSHTNTHAPAKRLRALYYRVLAMPGVIGIAVGTRPDCLDEAKIALFEEISRDFFVTLEIGLQSVHDRTLRAMNRGHTVSDFIECIQRIQGKRIFIGTHMILGLPGETREEILEGAHVIGAMDIDFLKLHQLQIVSGSPLATRHKVSPVKTLAYDEYLNLVCDYIERIPPRIIVQRFFSRAPQHLLLAPRWDKSDMQILKDIEISMRKRGSFQGLRCRTSFNALEISVSRSSEGS